MKRVVQITFAYFLLCGLTRSVEALPRNVFRTNVSNFESQCPSIRRLSRNEIWKSTASNHIRDQRRKSTSFIGLRGAKKLGSCVNVVDSSGNVIHKLGRYSRAGAGYAFRMYGRTGCGDGKSAATVSNLAKSNTGSATVYIDTGSVCIEVPDPAKCYNSSASNCPGSSAGGDVTFPKSGWSTTTTTSSWSSTTTTTQTWINGVLQKP